jgi:hypothetical protein
MTKPKRILITHFAPAERVPIEITRRQAAAVKKAPVPLDLLSGVLNYVFILNAQRQIVYASRNVPNLLPDRKRKPWLGLRPGEAMGCVHANESEGGCGTSESCRKCGAVRAVLDGLAGEASLRQFRLKRVIGGQQEALQFLALAAPLVHKREPFSLLVLTDSADAKAKQALKRVFTRLVRDPLQVTPEPRLA